MASVFRRSPAGVELLLIQRAERPGDHWSGHMAFPGGRADPTDADLLTTAIRETREEVGLDLKAHARLLGPLDEVFPRNKTGLIVSPYVFELTQPAALVPNHEVAEALWARVDPLISGASDTEYPLEYLGNQVRFPAYKVDDKIVWGMTYFVLRGLFRLMDE